jgi:hypothetical protein
MELDQSGSKLTTRKLEKSEGQVVNREKINKKMHVRKVVYFAFLQEQEKERSVFWFAFFATATDSFQNLAILL